MIGFYDVVVLGDELAGAVSAALLARRGYRVLVLCSAPVEEDVVGGHAFPRAPLVLVGLEGAAWKRVAGELNMMQQLRRRATANHPAYQILLPDHRIDVDEELPRELGRELPDEVARVEAWAAASQRVSAAIDPVLGQNVILPPEGFWDRRDLKRIAAQLVPDDGDLLAPLAQPSDARALASLPARFGCDLEAPGDVTHARLYDLYRRGTWSFAGGREGLRAMLLERVKTYAGEVRLNQRVRGLATKRGKVVGVAVGDRDETVGCELAIGALPASELLPLWPDEPPRRLRELAELPVKHRRYRLHLVAPLEALPDPLGRLAFALRDPAAPLDGDNAFSLQVTEGQGSHAILTVEALASDWSPEALAALRTSLLREVGRIVPFLDEHLRAAWSPHEARAPEGSGEATRSDEKLTPTLPDAIWDLPQPRALGICGLGYSTGAKNLYLASRQNLPGLGLEGELTAGATLAQLVIQRYRKRTVDKGALLAEG